MARKPSRPGRTLTIFGLCMVVLFGLVALAGQWKPSLGLDLQGGQRITLRAADDNVPQSQLKEAAKIINSRVNGSGVAEADVTTQGNTNIVVEIPGDSNQGLVDVVQRQAQLRFRLVACSTQNPGPCAAATPSDGSLPGVTTPNRAAPQGLLKPSADKKDPKKAAATESPSADPERHPRGVHRPRGRPAGGYVGRRRPRLVDRAQPGVGEEVQRRHLPARRGTPGRPGQAAGHLRRRRRQVPPLRARRRGHRARRAPTPARTSSRSTGRSSWR